MKIKIYKDSDKEQKTPIKILNVSPGKKSWEQLIKFCEDNNISDALSIHINGLILYCWDEIDEWVLGGVPNWAR